MNAVLKILPGSPDAEKCTLVCEISREGFSYAIKNNDGNIYAGVVIYQFENVAAENFYDSLKNVLDEENEILSKNFSRVCIAYSVTESVLVPFSLYNSEENKTALNCIHGDLQHDALVLSDMIAEKKIYNCYRLPVNVSELVSKQFPVSIQNHQYSILLKQYFTIPDIMQVIFYHQRIVVMLVKDEKLQFINSFQYYQPEDVSYILLNISKQFELNNMPVEISGMIEKDSALHKQVYKYFSNINFAALPGNYNYADEILNYPSHYFSSIFAADQCE